MGWFACQLDQWRAEHLSDKLLLLGASWGCFEKRLTFESLDWEHSSLTNVLEVQSAKGWAEVEARQTLTFSHDNCLLPQNSGTLGLWAFRLTLEAPNSLTFGLWWQVRICLLSWPWSWNWVIPLGFLSIHLMVYHIMGLLGLDLCESILKLNLFIYAYI